MKPQEVELTLKFSREIKDGIWRGIQLGAKATLESGESLAMGMEALYEELQLEGSVLWGRWYKGAAQQAVGDEEIEELPAPLPEAPKPPTEPAEPPSDPSWCAVHQCKMKQYTKGESRWYSHRLDDGTWCKGEAK